MKKNEIESYAVKAIGSKEFTDKHPKFFRKVKIKDRRDRDILEIILKLDVNVKTLATACWQDVYNSEFIDGNSEIENGVCYCLVRMME
jgi:5'(3')-deoxyribonucleotidase